jgi:hypothetical protein
VGWSIAWLPSLPSGFSEISRRRSLTVAMARSMLISSADSLAAKSPPQGRSA